MIQIKRVYDPPAPEDGARFLVDRLWPRGVKREALHLDGWLREAAPSDALRRWFWILPRFSSERGRPGAAYLTFFLLNAGVLLASVGTFLGAPALLLVLERLAEVGSAMALAIHAWPRVKPPGI